MPKTKKNLNRPQPKLALIAALVLIVLGIIGLALGTQSKTIGPSSKGTANQLRVIEGTGRSPQDANSQSGAQLQRAARTQDLIQSKDGSNLQRGSSVDVLLKNKELK